MPANDLDIVMAELGLPPFLPTSSIGHRRSKVWAEVRKAAVLAQIPAARTTGRAGWLRPQRPAALVRAPRNNNSLIRSLFVAALTGITEQDAQLIARCHFDGEGRFKINHARAIRTAFRILTAGLGWGVEVLPNGLARIYR